MAANDPGIVAKLVPLGDPPPLPARPERRHALHTQLVHGVAVLPDGDTVVSAGEDGALLASSLESGAVKAKLEGHAGPVNSLARTPDGERIVTGGDDGDLRVWDARSFVCERVLQGHTAYVRTVAATNARALSGAEDNTLRVWDLRSGQLERVIEGHSQHVRAVAISPDGRLGAASSLDGALWIWDLDAGEIVRKLMAGGGLVVHVPGFSNIYHALPHGGAGHRDAPACLCFLGDDRLVSAAAEIIVWDLQRGEVAARLPRPGWPIEAVLPLPEGRVVAGANGAHVWNLADRRREIALDAGGDEHLAFALTPGGQLVSGTKEGAVVVFPASALDASAASPSVQAEPVRVLQIVPPFVASGAVDGSVRVYGAEAEGGPLVVEEHNEQNGKPFALREDGAVLVTSSQHDGLFVWDLHRRALVRRVPIEKEGWPLTPHGLAFVGPESVLLGVLGAGLYRVDLSGGAKSAALAGRTSQIDAISLAPDGRRAFTLGYFATDPSDTSLFASVSQLQGWDLDAGTLLWTIAAAKVPGELLGGHFAFASPSPDGRMLVTGSGTVPDTLEVRDPATGALIRTIALPAESSPSPPRWIDGARLRLLSGSDENRSLLVDVAAGTIEEDVQVVAAGARYEGADSTGQLVLLSEGDDLLLVDAASGQTLDRVVDAAGGGRLRAAALSADGTLAAVGDTAGRTHLFRVERR